MTILLLRPYATFAQGATVDLDNATEAALVGQGRATYTVNPGPFFSPLTAAEQQLARDGGASTLTLAQTEAFSGAGTILTAAGGVRGLSEVTPEVLCNPTATTTVLPGPGVYAGYRCTTATGNITVYDSLSATGKVLVPTTALALGSFPIFGAGNPRALQVTIGVTVVLSGAGVVYAGVEAD